MKRDTITMFAACAAVTVAAGATLPVVELSHRWSFNDDFADSVGGADAVKCGTGYVDLGTNMRGHLETIVKWGFALRRWIS